MTYGRALRHLWGLEVDASYLNHGAFGATPLQILEEQSRLRALMERQPLRFFVEHAPRATRQAASELAAFVGGRPQDLAFVCNASEGINAVLRSQEWRRGDRVVAVTHVYPAVRQTLRFLADHHGVIVDLVEVGCPLGEGWLEQLDDRLRGARLAVLDHITSATALVLPIARMVAMCRDHGVPVLVDGAHAVGQVPLDVPALGATWYTSNAHKWLCAPKGCAFLWASDEGQETLHASVISMGYGGGLAQEFDYTGTRDVTPWLAIPAVLAFRRALGGVRDRNHRVALEARKILIDRLDTIATGGPENVGSMVAVRVGTGGVPDGVARSAAIWHQHRIEVPVFSHDDQLWMRVSVQAYNELDEVERLAEVIANER